MRPTLERERPELVAGRPVEEGDAVPVGHQHLLDGHDLDARQLPGVDRVLDVRLLAVAEPADRDALLPGRELRLQLGRVPAEQLGQPAGDRGRVVDRGGTGDDGRAGADVGGLDEARSLGVERHLAGHRIDHEQPVAGDRQDGRAVLRDDHVVDRDTEVGDLERLDALRPADVDLGEVERVQLPGLGCGEQLARRRIVGQGTRRAEVVSRDLGARAEVVAADPRVSREPQPCARLVAGRDVRVARLDQRVVDRGLDRARCADPVVAERGDPRRDQVLAEVRVGPLVDVALVAVPPVLEELGRGARVVDLVEVHVQRLPEPERAQHERGHDQHHEQPQVELVEATAALVGERCAPVGHDRPLAEPLAEPQAERALAQDRARAPRRRGLLAAPRRPAPASSPARCSTASPAKAAPAALGSGAASGMGRNSSRSASMTPASASSSASRSRPSARSWTNAQTNPSRWTMAMTATHSSSLIECADAQPVADPVATVVVDRREDDVHVRERRGRQEDVHHAPAERHGGEDRAQRVEREQVALVDARGHDEETRARAPRAPRAACVCPGGAQR